MSCPSTRGRTVTVLKATTEPSASSRTGTSVREAVATATGTGGGPEAGRLGVARGCHDVRRKMAPMMAAPTRTIAARRVRDPRRRSAIQLKSITPLLRGYALAGDRTTGRTD